MYDILSRIVGTTKEYLAGLKRAHPLADVKRAVRERGEDRFRSLFDGTGMVVIAEVKQASPSKGVFTGSFDPAAIAREYTAGGADAISVLTERENFRGSMDHLKAVRAATSLPVLRKDFIIDEYQVYEAAAAGADTFLLIAALFDVKELASFIALGVSLRMTPLVEVHTREELATAVDAGAYIIGINNRDLTDFSVTLATTAALAPLIPADRVIVSESGIFTGADAAAVRKAGARGILVGEALMRAEDRKAKLWELKNPA